MEKTSKELLKEFVSSQHFTSTTDIINSMKELFRARRNMRNVFAGLFRV